MNNILGIAFLVYVVLNVLFFIWRVWFDTKFYFDKSDARHNMKILQDNWEQQRHQNDILYKENLALIKEIDKLKRVNKK